MALLENQLAALGSIRSSDGLGSLSEEVSYSVRFSLNQHQYLALKFEDAFHKVRITVVFSSVTMT